MTPFSDRLACQIRQKQTPVLVGLDPRWAQIPEILKQNKTETNPQDVAEVFENFCKKIIDVTSPLVPAVKPQAAFFEQYGPLGMQCLANVSNGAEKASSLVGGLMDIYPLWSNNTRNIATIRNSSILESRTGFTVDTDFSFFIFMN